MKQRNFLFGKRTLFIRLLSATIPPYYWAFYLNEAER